MPSPIIGGRVVADRVACDGQTFMFVGRNIQVDPTTLAGSLIAADGITANRRTRWRVARDYVDSYYPCGLVVGKLIVLDRRLHEVTRNIHAASIF